MSIASIGLINQVNVQNIAVGNGTASGGSIFLTNDNFSAVSGQPNAQYQIQCVNSQDPTNASSLLFSGIINDPASPEANIMVMSSAGGSTVGNGSQVAFAGDMIVEGAFGLTSNTQSKTGGSITSSVMNDFQDNSYVIIDLINKMCTLYINVSGKMSTNVTGQGTVLLLLNTSTSVSGSIILPTLNSDYINDEPVANPITMYATLNNSTPSANSYTGLFYVQQLSASSMNFIYSGSLNLATDDEIVIQGVLSYPN